MSSNDAADLLKRLRAAADAVGAHVVDGHVRTGQASTVPEVFLEPQAALALIAAARPRVLYIYAVVLDPDDLLEDARETLGLDEGERLPASLSAAIASIKRYAGDTCTTSAHFVVDSILHFTAVSTPWMMAFEGVMEQLDDAAREESVGVHERARAAEVAHVEALAKRLLADPAFHFGKTSAAKRHLLASAMFPDEDARLLDEVVDLAQRLDWLAQSGFGTSGGQPS